MFNLDFNKLEAIRLALQGATRISTSPTVKPTSLTASVLQCKTETSKPANFRNVKRQDRKEPAAFAKVRNIQTGEIAETHAAKQSRLEARAANTETALRKVAKSPKQIRSVPVVGELPVAEQYESTVAMRNRLRKEASEILAKDKTAEQAALPAVPDKHHSDILREIAGYDPNEVQGTGDVIFRPKAGGRKRKSAHRFQYMPTSEYNATIVGELREVVAKIGDFDVHYVHRETSPPMPYLSERHLHNLQFPDSPITDDDVRQAVNEGVEPMYVLLTSQEDAAQQIERTDHRRANGMEVSADVPDPIAGPISKYETITFHPGSHDYKFQQAVAEFGLAFAQG